MFSTRSFSAKTRTFSWRKEKIRIGTVSHAEKLDFDVEICRSGYFYVNGDTDFLKGNSNRFEQALIPAWKRPFRLIAF